jgi:4-alpha-glucanotransferase
LAPLRFAFGMHNHQPVGNFDHVFADHVREVYQPFLERIAAHGFLPVALHISGPLLEWLETHEGGGYLDLVGRLVADGRLELLLAGFYEPVLAALPRRDRLEQIGWMREALRRRFGVIATGLWLTERVWEPELAADLADAGVRFALVDDRHFLVTGFEREQLHAPFRTESGGKSVALFPIDERLRYLVPFQPPADVVTYLERLGEKGHRLAVLADDGEKFGGWPGTLEWVYQRGWLDRFLETMAAAAARGVFRLSTFDEALRETPSGGLAYLPTASYREMEGWALPPRAAGRLRRLEHELGEARIGGPDGALVRGAHWRNFLVKYPEANRAHKKMLALSALCRVRGDPDEARRAIGRAQCNDAYWHGIFGGLYLPHLRNAVWEQLAIAERWLRASEGLTYEVRDLDGDGYDEVWIHSAACSVVVAPSRGGAVEDLTLFGPARNFAAALTRRREAYHEPLPPAPAGPEGDDGGMSLSHRWEAAFHIDGRLTGDREDRALFVDRIVPADLAFERYAAGDYTPLASWARTRLRCRVSAGPAEVVVQLEPEHQPERFAKEVAVAADGRIRVRYRLALEAPLSEGLFAPELSFGTALDVRVTPDAPQWRFPIETVAQSQRGLERTTQGVSVTPRWPASAGEFTIAVDPPAGDG